MTKKKPKHFAQASIFHIVLLVHSSKITYIPPEESTHNHCREKPPRQDTCRNEDKKNGKYPNRTCKHDCIFLIKHYIFSNHSGLSHATKMKATISIARIMKISDPTKRIINNINHAHFANSVIIVTF